MGNAVRTVKNVAKSVWSGVKQVAKTVWSGVKQVAKTVVTAATYVVKKAVDVVKAVTYNLRLTYYKCPSCGNQVRSIGLFEGNICWKCPFTLLHGFVKLIPGIGQIERTISGTFG